VTTVFPAESLGHCRACDAPIEPDELVAPADDEYVHAVHHDDPAVRAAARRSPTSKNPGRRPARSRTARSTSTATSSRTTDTADGTSRSAAGSAKRRPTIRAQHPGRCPSCRGGWRVGTWITLVDETWVHRVCVDGQRSAPKWTRTDSPETRAYKAAAAAGKPLPRRRSAWTK
jgi:hypothetical protein